MTTWAIVLSGGRSQRLGGHDKARLNLDGQSLLERAVAACRPARRIVIVGPPQPLRDPTCCVFTREQPAFGGPARGLLAGLDRLSASGQNPVSPADAVHVLACDVPGGGPALSRLRAEFATLAADVDGVLARDQSGCRQPLLAIYRYGALQRAAACFAGEGRSASMRALLAPLKLIEIPLEPAATSDIDTWEQAEGFGIVRPGQPQPHPVAANAATTSQEAPWPHPPN